MLIDNQNNDGSMFIYFYKLVNQRICCLNKYSPHASVSGLADYFLLFLLVFKSTH